MFDVGPPLPVTGSSKVKAAMSGLPPAPGVRLTVDSRGTGDAEACGVGDVSSTAFVVSPTLPGGPEPIVRGCTTTQAICAVVSAVPLFPGLGHTIVTVSWVG